MSASSRLLFINEDSLEKDGCGVGFVVSLKGERTNHILKQGLHALECMEHRGGTGPGAIGDGAGIMTAIPYELFGRDPGTFAVAFLYAPPEKEKTALSLKVFEDTFWQFGLKVSGYRDVQVNRDALSEESVRNMPYITQAIIERPKHCRTLYSFERLLYHARMATRTKEKEHGIYQQFYFSSLSPRSIVYKALAKSGDLRKFYGDLQDDNYLTNFALIHRRFSTNTISTWDKVQPFRLIAHNGEINTIEGNKAWAITREKDLGLQAEELITHKGMSDSGNLNMVAEGLRYRSSIPKLSEVMAILIPPADSDSNYYKFWSRGMEPWDGPAMVTYSDGKYIGARLDRNGFRPCRWQKTHDHFFLGSEAGVFDVAEDEIIEKGALSSGESVTVNVLSGQIFFDDPQNFPENKNASFDAQTIPLEYSNPPQVSDGLNRRQALFGYSKEDVDKIIVPMTRDKKEPLGSMGDTAALPFLSDKPRSIFDFFYQDFAQVTNPPIDYIREKIVTDMRVFLGRKPNIFEPKEFIPLKACLELKGPVISLGQMEYLKSLSVNPLSYDLRSARIDLTFRKGSNVTEFLERLEEMKKEAIHALKKGYSLLILSDRSANEENLPIPSLIAMSYINVGLNETGQRLRASLIMEVGDVKNPHDMACLLSYGASVVCPYLALESAVESKDPGLSELFAHDRELNIIKSFHDGVLRIMAKRGISVFRSYQGSRLFTPIGLGEEVMKTFFRGKSSLLGGMDLEALVELMHKTPSDGAGPVPSYLYKEHAAMKEGELHTLTSRRAKLIHKLVSTDDSDEAYSLFRQFSGEIEQTPILIRHLLGFRKTEMSEVSDVEPVENILRRFGSGAMSFGAISAESQRDLIIAFRKIQGRSNSGEGGENPYFEKEGIAANIKQIASGRFGVTAEYLVNSEEIQIKIAQGAKPGEGGQLMGVKVTDEIAKARFTSPGVDLISPAPQHDIYSIEDLKELIHELRALAPHAKISVKLVSGDNVGAIAVGVAKAGADIIQISGGDGGTGAASLLSMKHAGLPLEPGLLEVHRALTDNGLRKKVILRADGGFYTGKDLVVAAMMGADQFDFGKLVLVGEGCIMARVCEKNTCPAGIATHNAKFKAHYKGDPEKVVRLLSALAREVRDILKDIGVASLDDVIGQNHRLIPEPKHAELIRRRKLNLEYFTREYPSSTESGSLVHEAVSPLNLEILKSLSDNHEYSIRNHDRAIPATLSGHYALKKNGLPENVSLRFRGSAGQGFGVFNVPQINLRLIGEANDSVGKGMSGGTIVIIAPAKEKEQDSIIGNCALYGATGGVLFVGGYAGDRFAVRNSGATAVVEGVGLHACEYMSGGMVWILGKTKRNIGAGMTGGVGFVRIDSLSHLNLDSVVRVPVSREDEASLMEIGQKFLEETGSITMKGILERNDLRNEFIKIRPKAH